MHFSTILHIIWVFHTFGTFKELSPYFQLIQVTLLTAFCRLENKQIMLILYPSNSKELTSLRYP